MQKAVDTFSDQLLAIRPGVINAGAIETVKVNCYGDMTPIKYIAQVFEGQGITIKPHDPQLTGAIQKTLELAGHSCYACKNSVMVNIPKFTTSADKDRAIATVHRLEEETKIVIRNIRKKIRKELVGSDDEIRNAEKELQVITDKYIAKVSLIAANKVQKL